MEIDEWVCDHFTDPHTVYRLTARFARRDKVTVRLRFSEFYDLMMRVCGAGANGTPSTRAAVERARGEMPDTHYVPLIGKYLDTDADLRMRAAGMQRAADALFASPASTRMFRDELMRMAPTGEGLV